MTETLTEQGLEPPEVSDDIFRAYDIRGVVDQDLTVDVVRAIGWAAGSMAQDKGHEKICVARDGRLSGPALLKALIQGLVETGIDVIDVGMVPTPTLYFAAHHLQTQAGVMLTGSHNPANYNGLKLVIEGAALWGEQIQLLKTKIRQRDFRQGLGSVSKEDIQPAYFERIVTDVKLSKPLKVVVDCGNGVTGTQMPDIFQALGCDVQTLYQEVDGNFPNHHPDPSNPANLEALREQVQQSRADVGFAFDGDGDRIGVVTNQAQILYPDRLLMLFAKHLLQSKPGETVIFDVKCTADLSRIIKASGGHPLMWKTGHSLIKAKLKETNAMIAGEMSGHIFFNDRWYGFDDAIYSAARLLEMLSQQDESLHHLCQALPQPVCTPELNMSVAESLKFEIVERLKTQGDFGDGVKTEVDGIRVDYPNGWGLVRASNTSPVLVARFEANTEAQMQDIQAVFRQNLLKVAPELALNF